MAHVRVVIHTDQITVSVAGAGTFTDTPFVAVIEDDEGCWKVLAVGEEAAHLCQGEGAPDVSCELGLRVVAYEESRLRLRADEQTWSKPVAPPVAPQLVVFNPFDESTFRPQLAGTWLSCARATAANSIWFGLNPIPDRVSIQGVSAMSQPARAGFVAALRRALRTRRIELDGQPWPAPGLTELLSVEARPTLIRMGGAVLLFVFATLLAWSLTDTRVHLAFALTVAYCAIKLFNWRWGGE